MQQIKAIYYKNNLIVNAFVTFRFTTQTQTTTP